MNGNAAMSPSPIDVICRITEARFVRRISGSVNSPRLSKSSSLYSRMQMPSLVRPQRPLRWFALACDTDSMGRCCTFVRWLYREIRAVPGSTTYLIPGTVSEVSATLVASTIRRPGCDWNTRCCSAADSRAYSGRISVSRRFCARSASAVSRISRSPLRKTSTSPGASSASSSTASRIACVWSRSIVDGSSGSLTGRYRVSTG